MRRLPLRAGVAILTATALAVSGCASRLPPPTQATLHGVELVGTLSALPHIVADEQPIGFVGFNPSDEEREALEVLRRNRVAARTRPASAGSPPSDCMNPMVAPLCILAFPIALIASASIEHGVASGREPSVPSDRGLARMGEQIQQRIAADGLRERALAFLGAGTEAADENRYPRLVIRAESATFKYDTVMTIGINVVAQAQPSSSVEWPLTQHYYQIRYTGDQDRLARELLDAREALAQSIASTYLPTKSAVAAATSPVRAGDVFSYRVVDHSGRRTMTFISRVSTGGIGEEISSDESGTSEWLKADGRDVIALGMSTFGGIHRLTCPAERTCSVKAAPERTEGIKLAAGIFDASKLVAKQTWVGSGSYYTDSWKGSRTLTVWYVPHTGRVLKMSISDSLFSEKSSGDFEVELVSYQAN